MVCSADKALAMTVARQEGIPLRDYRLRVYMVVDSNVVILGTATASRRTRSPLAFSRGSPSLYIAR